MNILNFDLLLMWERLKSCQGSTRNGQVRGMVVCNSELEGECIWWSGMKICKRHGKVLIKDMDYSFMTEARLINSERYLKRLVRLVKETDKSTLFHNRADSDYVKKMIRGICRFGDHLSQGISEEKKSQIKKELKHLPLLQVAARHNVTEHYCKKVKYGKA